MRFRFSLLVVAVFVVAAAAPGGPLHGELDTSLFPWVAERVLNGDIPYRDFSLEYPPGALLPLVLPELAGHAHYAAAFVVLEFLVLLASLVLVFVVTRAPARVAVAALALYALGPVLLIRFDPWAALLTLAGTAALVAAQAPLGFALLGVAAATKLYALALLPVGWLYAQSRRALLAFVTAGSVLTVPFVVAGPGGVASSLDRQLGRGLELESLGASILLALDKLGLYGADVGAASGSFDVVGTVPDAMATVQTLLLLAVLALLYVFFARSDRSTPALLVTVAAVVAATVALGKVLSPQFLVWAIVLVVLVPGRAGLLGSSALIAASALTHVLYPGRHEALVNEQALPVWILLGRNLLLVSVAALLVRSVRALPRGAPAAARGSSTGRRAVRSRSSSGAARAG